MTKNKLDTITNLFQGNEIRSVWDAEKEDYYFSVVDVISALTNNDYQKSRNYWKWLKNRLNGEESELVSNTNQLKLKARDGKYQVAKNAHHNLKQLGKLVLSKTNSLNYQYGNGKILINSKEKRV